MQSGRWLLLSVTAMWASAAVASAAPPPPLAGPDLSLEVVTPERSSEKGRTDRPSPSGATLVLNSLSEEERSKLAESLHSLAAAAARKRNPFYVAIDDTEEHAAAQKLFAETAPAFTAAAALSRGRWFSAEGDLAVQVVKTCSPGSRCMPLLSQGPGDGFEQRIRFLAWPVGYAVILRTAENDVVQVAGVLRADPASSQIALVLTGAELHSLRKGPALSSVLKSAARLAKKLPGSALVETLESIGRAASAGDEVPWLKLPRNTVLVVPRLGALATSNRFVDEINSRLQAVRAKVEWLSSPRKWPPTLPPVVPTAGRPRPRTP